MRYFSTALVVASLAGSPALSQNMSEGDGYDFDTLAACAVVYGQIGEIYEEREATDQAASFQSTSLAYSASAYHVLKYDGYDAQGGFDYGEDRMTRIVESLNAASDANSDGDMGVIEEWLPYCDTLGSGVNQILDRRDQDGW